MGNCKIYIIDIIYEVCKSEKILLTIHSSNLRDENFEWQDMKTINILSRNALKVALKLKKIKRL